MNESIVYEIVSDCQEWIIGSETKEWRGPASTLVKFVVTSKRKYEWVSQAQVKEATKLLTEILGHGKMPVSASVVKVYGPSMQCKACGNPLYGEDNLCNDCLKVSILTYKEMLWKSEYSLNQINDIMDGE